MSPALTGRPLSKYILIFPLRHPVLSLDPYQHILFPGICRQRRIICALHFHLTCSQCVLVQRCGREFAKTVYTILIVCIIGNVDNLTILNLATLTKVSNRTEISMDHSFKKQWSCHSCVCHCIFVCAHFFLYSISSPDPDRKSVV